MPRINVNDADLYNQSGSNGDWFYLQNDGDTARVQFLFDKYDDIDTFVVHKVDIDGKIRNVNCLRDYNQPECDCPLCASGNPRKVSSIVTMYSHDDGKVKIWERGRQFMQKMQGLCNRYQPLSNYVFEIERHGAKGSTDTRYEIYPMDTVKPVNLEDAGVEKPDLYKGVILDKTFSELQKYVSTGKFDDGAQGVSRRGNARGAAPSDGYSRRRQQQF